MDIDTCRLVIQDMNNHPMRAVVSPGSQIAYQALNYSCMNDLLPETLASNIALIKSSRAAGQLTRLEAKMLASSIQKLLIDQEIIVYHASLATGNAKVAGVYQRALEKIRELFGLALNIMNKPAAFDQLTLSSRVEQTICEYSLSGKMLLIPEQEAVIVAKKITNVKVAVDKREYYEHCDKMFYNLEQAKRFVPVVLAAFPYSIRVVETIEGDDSMLKFVLSETFRT